MPSLRAVLGEQCQKYRETPTPSIVPKSFKNPVFCSFTLHSYPIAWSLTVFHYLTLWYMLYCLIAGLQREYWQLIAVFLYGGVVHSMIVGLYLNKRLYLIPIIACYFIVTMFFGSAMLLFFLFALFPQLALPWPAGINSTDELRSVMFAYTFSTFLFFVVTYILLVPLGKTYYWIKEKEEGQWEQEMQTYTKVPVDV